jgi:hypothetical protein
VCAGCVHANAALWVLWVAIVAPSPDQQIGAYDGTVRARFRWEGLRAQADARVVALLRVSAAALVLADLVDRLRDFNAFYTAAGLVPVARAGTRFSLLALSEQPRVALAGFLLALAAATLALVGFQTRAAVVGMFVTLLSIQHRNPFIEDGGDAVLCAVVFWLMFIDSGARWSLDVRLGRRPALALVPATPVRLLQLQIAAIYLFAFVTKTGTGWRDGTAVQRVLMASDWARGLGPWVAQHPAWCRALTWATLVIEGAFAPLVLLPVRRLRWLALGAGLALHAGIFWTMRIGVFSLVMPLSYLAFVAHPVSGLPAPPAPPAEPGPPSTPAPLAIGLLALFGLIVAGQLCNLGGAAFPRPLAAPLELLGLRQDWRMFAPDAPAMNVTFSAPGQFADGHRADLLTTSLAGLGQHQGFRYSRWHRLRNALVGQPTLLLQALGRFTCRREPDLVAFELWATLTPVAPGAAPPEAPGSQRRLRQTCQPGGNPRAAQR